MMCDSIKTFIKQHFLPESYLSLHLIVGLVILLVTVLAFVSLTEDVAM
jgi:hypothetical protein